MGHTSRLRASAGLAWAQLRHARVRAVLAVLAVVLSVLLVVLLSGLAYGLATTGTEALGWIDHDLWVTGGAVGLAPSGIGGVVNPIEDAHGRADRIESRPDVGRADALAFQTVYVSTDGESFDTVVGVGTTGNGSALSEDAAFAGAERHYAGGSYDGPMTHEVIVDPRTAAAYDLSVGDELHVGATLTQARRHRFTVVAVSNTFSTFLGTSTVVLPLGELQAVSGTTGADRAAFVGVSLAPGADAAVTARAIERDHPGLAVRTKEGQLRAVVRRQAGVLAGAATLVGLAVVVGIALVANVLALVVSHQRRALAALKAGGVSDRLLVGTVVWQGLWLGGLGGVGGVLAAPPARIALNVVVADLTGFPALVETPPLILAGGLVGALVTGVAGAALAGWQVARVSPLEHLDA